MLQGDDGFAKGGGISITWGEKRLLGFPKKERPVLGEKGRLPGP